MPEIINRIFNGKLNLDVSPYKMNPQDFIDALNITTDAEGQSRDRVVSGVVGNELVDYTLPAGTNKCIGRYEDVLRNRVYYFVWNSNGNNLWLYWDAGTNTIIKLIEDLTDTNNVPVLDFNPSKRINHIDIIYRDESEGDLIFWTDGNVSPRKANVKKIEDGDYSVIKAAFIEAAKMPSLASPVAAYGSDSTRNANSLRRKLFQFTQRPIFDDYEKATWSAYSKIPLPVGVYGSDNEIDDTKNNFITVTVNTGDENVTAIEVAMRYNINNAWSDFVSVIVIDKAQLGIPNNTTYDHLFYNDAIYPPITQGVQYIPTTVPNVFVQVVNLFDWLPQLANCQAMGNGDTPIYGAITENYNNYPINDLDVTMTVENVTNVPPDDDPPQVTYQFTAGNVWQFIVTGTIPEGTRFYATAFIYSLLDDIVLYDYTSQPGDTFDDVVNGIFGTIDPAYQNGVASPEFFVQLGSNSFIITTSVTVPVTPSQISTEKVWLPFCNYIFGFVYVDEQNRDMPGVTTYSNSDSSDNDFLITTPAVSLSGTDLQTPVIEATVNHTPPTGAKAFYWVRRRMMYANPIWYMTCDFQEDSDYMYFCLANINAYKADNSQFIYDQATITPETRIKVMLGVSGGVYNGDIWTTNNDYLVLGTVTKKLDGGISPQDDRLFIKVAKPVAAVSPAYTDNMVVMLYEPMANPTNLSDSVYWEWGEGYEIYTLTKVNYVSASGLFTVGETITGGTSGATGTVFFDSGNYVYLEDVDGVFDSGETITGGTSGSMATTTTITEENYHRGGDQDQTPFQEAIYTWAEGDVYFHQRPMYTEILSEPFASATLNVMDANYSDFFNSAVNDNGRAQVIEVNARQQYNPVLVRFGGSYQAGTNINDTNRFVYENFDEYDRGNGDIMKLFMDRPYMYVFQKFDIGVVPVFLQVVTDVQGNPLQANSEQLLNKITYPYVGKFGIGDVPESFAFGKYAKYGVDSNKGVAWRLSQDGVTPLSVLYECNSFFVEKCAAYGKGLDNGNPPSGGVYTGNPTIYGVFNAYTNKYVIALEEINRYDGSGTLTFHQDAYTINFHEVRTSEEGFQSFLSFHPEMMGCLNNLLITFKDGQFWRHDSDTFCNFYGDQYDPYITAVFNDNPLEKKSFQALAEIANVRWNCPDISTDTYTYGTTNQQTSLMNGNFERLEGQWHAAIRRDINSRGGKVNGDFMKGKYMIIRFVSSSPSEFSFLSGATVKYNTSPLSI